MNTRPPVVAILNTNDDLVEMLRVAVELAGLIAVSLHLDDLRRAKVSLEDFVREHDPCVIVYDVAPPYEPSWRYLDVLRDREIMKKRQFVVTSTNVTRARESRGTGENVFEIVGKPYDIERLVDIIREAAKARPVR